MTSPITPDTVRALIADTGPEDWRAINGADDPDPAWGSFPMVVTESSGDEAAIVRNCSNGDAALMAASKRIALAYLAVVAERDRLARVLAVEGGDESAAPEGWGTNGDGWSNFEHSRHAHPAGRNAYINGEFVAAHMWQWSIDERVDGWLMRGRGGTGYAPTALEAMEAADRAGGSDV